MADNSTDLTCSGCGILKPNSDFQSLQGHRTTKKCLQCRQAVNAQRHASRAQAPPGPGQKECSRCHYVKPIADFDSTHRQGTRRMCIACRDKNNRDHQNGRSRHEEAGPSSATSTHLPAQQPTDDPAVANMHIAVWNLNLALQGFDWGLVQFHYVYDQASNQWLPLLFPQ